MSTEPDFDALTDYLDRIQNDEALIGRFRARYPTLIRMMRESIIPEEPRAVLERLKPFADLGAMEYSIFDNGERSRGRGCRWKVRAKAYYEEKVEWEKPCWHGLAPLWTPKRVRKDTARLFRLGSITEATRDAILGFADAMPTFHIGVFRSQAEGTKFYQEHIAIVGFDADEIVTEAYLFHAGDMLVLPDFDTRGSSGKSLKGNLKYASRYSERDALDGWISGEGSIHQMAPISVNIQAQQ